MLLDFPKIKEKPFSNTKVWATVFWIAAFTLIVYLPALQNDFVNWDDDKYVYENEHIRSLDFKFLKWSFGFHILNWHPLTLLSHSIDYALWGLNPIGHHLMNIIFHSINTFLLFILIVYLLTNVRLAKSSFSETNYKTATGNIIAASVTALLFGIHPIHVESVAWVSERKDVLSTFFVLLSLIFYSKYALYQEIKRKSWYYILSLSLFVLALMSKPMAVTVPLMLVILDIFPFQRFSSKNSLGANIKLVMEKLPFILFSLISTALTIIAQHSGHAIASLKTYPLFFRIATAISGLTFYLEKILLPIGLSPFYPLPTNDSFFSLKYILAAVLVVSITIFCVWAWKGGSKIYAAVWAYYVITLLPVIGIIQLGEQAAADRYSYMPGIGPFFLIGLGISYAWGKNYSSKRLSFFCKKIILFMLILIFLTLSILTVKQTKIWTDSITLWSYELKRYPDFWLAYYNRAHAYTTLGEYKHASKDIDKAISYNPKFPQSYYLRAVNYIGVGDYRRALTDLDKAIKLDPQFAEAYYIRSKVYIKLGNYQKALKDLDNVIELKSEFIEEAHRNKCELYKKLSDHQQANKDCTKAIEFDTDN